MTTKAVPLAELVSLGCVALLYLSLTSGTWFITPDSPDYVEAAVSLSRGEGLVFRSGEPVAIVPPGTATVYALAALLPAADYRYFNLLTKVFAIGFVAVSYLLIRRQAGRPIAGIAAISLALSPVLLVESTRLLSDVLFGFVLVLTLYLYPEDTLDEMPVTTALRLAVLLSCAYLIRTVGLALCLGYLAFIVLSVQRHRWRTVAAIVAVFGSIAVLLAVRAQRIGGISYIDIVFTRVPWVDDSGAPSLLEWIARLSTNALDVIGHAAYVWPGGTASRLATWSIVVLASLGIAARLAGRGSWLHTWLLVFYTAALLLTLSEPRYLLVISPLVALLIADGASLAARHTRLPRVARRAAVAALMLAIVAPGWFASVVYAREIRARVERSKGTIVAYRGHEAFLDLVREHASTLSTEDVVATNHAAILRYFVPNRVRVRELPILRNSAEALRRLDAAGVTYLFCDKSEPVIWEHTREMIRAHAQAFRLVAETEAAAIYHRVRDASAPSDRPNSFFKILGRQDS